MAEAIVAVVLHQLDFIIPYLDQEVRLVVGVRKEVIKLKNLFRAIHAVLNDAEKRQVKDELVKVWLAELKDTACDMDDVLDEWRTKIDKGVDDRHTSEKKVCCSNLSNPCSCFKSVDLFYKISHRIKKIKARLDDLAKFKNMFEFRENMKIEDPEDQQMTSSIVDVSDVCGREWDIDIITDKLLSESSQQEMGLSVITIFGMGGLGKTTLAQLVFNDEKVKDHFQKRMWVCASEPFKKERIATAIIEAAGKRVPNFHEWNALHNCLCNSVEGKRFLLVLDDVWTEDHTKWEQLKISLKRGAQGSRIVVTTRNESVAEMMKSTYIHRLKELPEKDCWSLFSRIAFEGRGKEEREKLKEIGKKITAKCKGVPLSVKTLGSLMYTKKAEKDWEDVLKSDTWELPEVERYILPALLLSYNELPLHLKQCFTYCAIFPKDDKIEKDLLIKLWMAQGFFSTMGGRELEKKGEECFEKLVKRSFFQDVKDVDGHITHYKMHDLLHEFAQFLTKNECLIMEIDNTDQLISDKVRHLMLVWNVDMDSVRPSIKIAKKLRTLLRCGFSLLYKALPDLLNHFTCLRALDLRATVLESLPREIEKLIHLRYLDLSETGLKELPEIVCNLYNLQTLKLNWCVSLHKLPEGMGRIINMRHLDIEGTPKLCYLPQGIGKLSSLRTLSKFIVGGESGECKIGELKDLNLLQGYLEISGFDKVINVNEAKEVELNKKQLCILHLSFKCIDGLRDGMEDVLEVLQPHPSLEELRIHQYPGTNFPCWMGDSMFSKLHSLKLTECKNCVELPALGKLPSLQRLNLSKIGEVKYIGLEFYGIGADGVKSAFPKLKVFDIDDMPNLEEWDLKVEYGEIMPCLCYLSIVQCPKLKALPALGKLPSLEELKISNMDEMKHIGPEFYGIGSGSGSGSGSGVVKGAFPKLKELTFTNMSNLEEWELGVEEGGETMPCLLHLSLENFMKLQALPALGKLPSLVYLKMEEMNAIKYVGNEFYGDGVEGVLMFPKLETLQLYNMRNWEEWKLPVEEDRDTIMPCLQHVDICSCPNLKVLPNFGKLTSLKSLHVQQLDELRFVGIEFLGIGDEVSKGGESLIVFPKLEELTFQDMCNWEEWEMTREGEGNFVGGDIIIMPRIRQLFLLNCPKLKACPHQLRTLTIEKCLELTWRTPSSSYPLPLIEELTLQGDTGVLSKSLPFLPNLKSLVIEYSTYPSLPEGLGQLTALQCLDIQWCESLTCMSEELQLLTMLRELKIDKCQILGQRCWKEVGEDWRFISHIPNIVIDGEVIQ